MTSGFSSGGADYYCGGGGISGSSIAMNSNAQALYRSQQQQQNQQQQFPGGIVIDPSSQILQRRSDLIRKRPMPDFRNHHHHYLLHHYQQQGLNGHFLRSVKPRNYHQTASPISPLSPVDFSTYAAPAAISPEFSSALPSPTPSSRFGLPVLRSQLTHNAAPCPNLVPKGSGVAAPDPDPDPEKKMMNRLQELEKELLDDDDQTDAVSVVTNSEWSGSIQTLLDSPPVNPNQDQNNSVVVSPSPTSSSSSSSSSSLSSSAASSPQTSQKQSLVEAATSISEGNPEKALEILTRASHVLDSKGRSDQRVAAIIVAALRRRVGGNIEVGAMEVCDEEHAAAMQVLYEVSPCFKLGLWAANQAILDATSDLPEKIHLVDFDGGSGSCAVQYVNLVQALTARGGGKPLFLRITSVLEPGNEKSNGADERLRKLCERGGVVSVKIEAVSLAASGLTRDSLGCDPDEAVVVNLAFKLYRMPDESVRTDNPRDDLLRRVKALRPRVVTMVEQEINGNTAPFVTRVKEVCAYYEALFDSLDSFLVRDHPDRFRLENGLGRKMANSVACEGVDRLERCEMFGKWRARMRMAGFEPRPLSQNVAESLHARVNSGTRGNMGFTVKEVSGGICFGWMGRILTVASAWR